MQFDEAGRSPETAVVSDSGLEYVTVEVDIFLGTTASRVQHSISVPVLLLRAK